MIVGQYRRVVFVPVAVDQDGDAQRSWVGPGGVIPIQQEQPPADVRPPFQMMCGGQASTCHASPMFAGPRLGFPHMSTDKGAGWVVLASPFIRAGGPLAAPRCASSQACMSAADDLISEAAPDDTSRPLGWARQWSTVGHDRHSVGHVQRPGDLIVQQALIGQGISPAAQPYAETAVKPSVTKPRFEYPAAPRVADCCGSATDPAGWAARRTGL